MSDWACRCDRKVLRDKGCQCRNLLPRTMPINLLLSVVGWRKFWANAKDILPFGNLPDKEPMEDADIVVFLIDLEQKFPDLYDELARKMEAKHKNYVEPPKVTFKGKYSWEV